MMILAVISLLLAPLQDSAATPARRDVLTVADALFTIEGVSGRVQAIGDVDGDGLADFVAERGGDRSRSGTASRLEVVSTKSGETLRVLWAFDSGEWWYLQTSARTPYRWDARGDVNHDGTRDVVVGDWRHGAERAGAVVVISGADARHVQFIQGEEALDGFGYCVAILGDVDGDGYDDYAVGAPQVKVEEVVISQDDVVSEEFRWGATWDGAILHFKDGTQKHIDDYARERLDARSTKPGYVSVFSGKDGAELARFVGERAGHGFGTQVVALGDLDGDGHADLGIASANESKQDVLIVSVAKKKVIERLQSLHGRIGTLGDVNGDGTPDFYQARTDRYKGKQRGPVSVLSGSNGRELFELSAPFWAPSKYVLVASVGDLDGDGKSDIAVADANFNLSTQPESKGARLAADLAGVSLHTMLAHPSEPRIGPSWESGCVWIYSSATQQVMLGAWGLPGSRPGLGLDVASCPNVNGDGVSDFVVQDESKAYIFAGFGAVKK